MDTNQTPQKDSDKTLGVTFTEVRSDEPHEGLTPAAISHIEKTTGPKSHLTGSGEDFNVTSAFTGDQPEMGAIVSDRRHTRVPFSKSLKMAFSEWFGKTKETISELQEGTSAPTKSMDVPKISKAETRKEVLDKAVVDTHLAPKDDTHVTIEKIKTYQKDVSRVTHKPHIREDIDSEKTGWTHTKDEVKTPHVPLPTYTEVSTPHEQVSKTVSEKEIIPPVVEKGAVAPVVHKNDASSKFPSDTSKHASLPSQTIYFKQKPEPVTASDIHVAPVVSKRAVYEPSPEEKQPKEERSRSTWSSAKEPSPTVEKTAVSQPKNSIPDNLPIRTTDVPPPVSQTPTDSIPSNRTIESQNVDIESQKSPLSEPSAVEEPLVTDNKPEFHSTPLPYEAKQGLQALKAKRDVPVSQDVQTKELPGRNNSRLIIIGGVVTLILIIGIGLGVVAKRHMQEEQVPQTPTTILPIGTETSFINSDHNVAISLQGSPEVFRETLRATVESAPAGFTELHPVFIDGTTSRQVTAREFLGFVGNGLPQETLYALEEKFAVGSITTTENEPYLLLRSSQFDTLFTGMLAWEERLQSDLTPLFGTDIQYMSFRDGVRANTPARILRDSEGNEIVVYAIIDRDTVIITSTSEALILLIPEIN